MFEKSKFVEANLKFAHDYTVERERVTGEKARVVYAWPGFMVETENGLVDGIEHTESQIIEMTNHLKTEPSKE